MASKLILTLCSSVLLVQAFGQAINLGGNVDINVNAQSSANSISNSAGSLLLQQNSGRNGAGLGLSGLATPSLSSGSCSSGLIAAPIAYAAPTTLPAANSNGGTLLVTSSSALAPKEISVSSANDINGQMIVAGELPLLAAVAFEGQVPSGGSAGVSYSCGDSVGITSVESSNVRSTQSLGYGGLAGSGLNNAGGCSCSCY